ncbi:MAG: phage holin family protein [Rhodobacterales bacterium]|nr:phage holin family protein [Rhodobacterales bacterium]
MIPGLIQPLQLLSRVAGDAARAALRRAEVQGAAFLIATFGAGFLLLAAFLALRLPLGSMLAALVMGAALLVVSAVLVLAVRTKAQKARPMPLADPRQRPPSATPPTAADAAAMAVFMVAFLIGRRLADRWDQTR